MTLLILSYIGGFLTILSPCILPVLPFVFAKADQPFYRSSLPLLAGMAVTFTTASLLAVLGGAWVAEANNWGRWIAMVLLAVFGLSLIFPIYLETLMAPLTKLGVKLTGHQRGPTSPGQSFVIGIATGFLWAPCAGPILGLILTGAAVQGKPSEAASFLFAYALGAGSSLALALLAGGKVFTKMKGYLKAEGYVKKILGVLVLLGVVAIAFNLDRTVLTQVARVQTETLEQHLLNMTDAGPANIGFKDEGEMPSIDGAVAWLNSPPLTNAELKGKVVLIDFWTYSCINCLRTLPYMKAWNEKYKDKGLVIIGVHTPEFAFEKDLKNVTQAAKDLGVTYPIAVDNNYTIWKAFKNQYWPAHYFVDRSGRIRHHKFGEGKYEESEKIIQELLGEEVIGKDTSLVSVNATGAQVSGQLKQAYSGETYLGYSRAENMKVTPQVVPKTAQDYKVTDKLKLNEWGVTGNWQINPQDATLMKAPGKISFRFRARDLHLVLGSATDGKEVRFKVTIDGQPPGPAHGMDIGDDGRGVVKDHRLYQLIRQPSAPNYQEKLFEIEFEDPGVQAFAFTFG
ncbi:MAG: cytochrome c biogenesis protein DipZ [Bdellovibrionales bacterium]|nr:cytochrome c biogenesis protein DipZ [Bdellovibrionales bacterium]